MSIGKKRGVTITMLIVYMMVLLVIMGAVILNFNNNDQVEELDKATYQARIIDYLQQFTTMREFYDVRGEYSPNIILRGNEKDIYGRTISDYIPSITSEDKENLCIFNGVLCFYNVDQETLRYAYLTELGLEQADYSVVDNDNIGPEITITQSILQQGKNIQIVINVTDNVGLSNVNEYKYYLSTSPTEQVNGEWRAYASGVPFTIGENLSGQYYLHVKAVTDLSGNVSNAPVSTKMTFDNTNPIITCTISETSDGLFTMNINITDNTGVDISKCYYTISESSSKLGKEKAKYDKVLSSTNTTVNAQIYGDYYFHVFATDVEGNTTEYISEGLNGTNITYANAIVRNFEYVGNYQEYIVPANGLYLFEAWGAQGGTYSKSGGYGGYTKGNIILTEGTPIYVYVGQSGGSLQTATFNGGGASATSYNARSGGGATDFRLVKGSSYSEVASLRSRIMVAAGGGGSDYYGSVGSAGGAGGGLTGTNGGVYNNGSNSYTVAQGGTQTAGGAGGKGASNGGAGSFGIGGSSTNNHGGGGGGGYYGGGSGSYNSSVVGSGAGGSSFISGHSGCDAINSVGAHTGTPFHYSGYAFTDTSMTAGSNSGNGKAKITQYENKYAYTATTGNVTLTSINVTTQPTKITYIVGDTVSMEGLVVTATYSDGTTSNIANLCTFSPALSEVTQTTGSKTITVTYQGKISTTKVNISVTTLPNENWIASSLNAAILYVEQTISGTTYYAPIPKGFEVIEGTISTGLVIQDSKGNQFVWVPVDNSYNITSALGTTITGKTALAYWQGNANGTGIEGTGYNETYPRTAGSSTKAEWDSMYASVIKYGGFYVGRYETGYETVEGVKKPVVQAGKSVWNSVPWGSTMTEFGSNTATAISRGMYTSEEYGVRSTLIYGIQWDSVMNWANCASKTRATSTYTSKPSPTGAVYADGTTYDVNKNIYDLAGNVGEWSMEAEDTTHRVSRGGHCYSAFAVSFRYGDIPNRGYSDWGFRAALYVK